VSPLRVSIALLAACLAALAVGCGSRDEPDLVQGKALFVQKCGSCHTLSRAGTQGTQGPDLDDAFAQARADGMGADTVRGIVRRQIAHPRKGSIMPAGLVNGGNAKDVASYVAKVAAQRGQDTGALATAGLAGAKDGKQIFVAAGCGGCHSLSDAGTNGNIGPNLNELASAAKKFGAQRKETPDQYVRESILKPEAFTVPGFRAGVMPSGYGDKLKPAQVKTLVQYLLKVGGGG
jgi:mono/diheme cytochrome c family protein